MSRIPRFFLTIDTAGTEPTHAGAGTLDRGDVVTLSGSPAELHHAINVLRLKPGDSIEAIDRSRKIIAKCSFIKTHPQGLVAEVIDSQPIEHGRQITLILGAPKRQVLEGVIEKIVELGVSDLVIFSAERSQGHDFDSALQKHDRLEKIANTAAKQSGNSLIPSIRFEGTLTEALRSCHANQASGFGEIRYLCSPFSTERTLIQAVERDLVPQTTESIEDKITDPDATHPLPVLNSLENSTVYADLFLIVGPEGGLSESEILSAIEMGYQPVSLGRTVLRVETAVVLACGILSIA